MNRTIKSIQYEFDLFDPKAHKPHDGIWDVRVELDDGTWWFATFITYAYVERIRKKNARTGEDSSGKYLCAPNMILIDVATRDSINSVIKDLLEKKTLDLIFAPFEPYEEDETDDS